MPTVEQLIRQQARARGLDPGAVIAVAMGEGGLVNRANDIGDLAGGGSYGPFQLYAKGALPRRYVGNQAVADAWAWSPAGINYALDRIAGVARGLRGAEAVNAIIRRFEKPARPDVSVSNALRRLGLPPGSAPSGPVSGPISPAGGGGAAAAGVPDPLADPLLQSVMSTTARIVGTPELPLGLLSDPASPLPAPDGLPPLPGESPSLAAARPIRGQAPARGSSVKWLTGFVKPYGVTITSTTGGRHTPTSWHYKARAVDVAGPADRMMAVARAALAQPHRFREVFYDPLGVYVKNGRVYKGAIGGHSDHVHIAA